MANTNTIMLGRGKLRVTEYSAYTDDLVLVLPSSEEVGSVEKCSMTTEMSFKENIALEQVLFRNDLYLSATLVDASQKNLNMFLGGDKTDSNSYIDIDNSSFSTYFRLEVFFTYPDKVTGLGLIIPKAQVIETNGLELVNLSEPSKPEIRFKSIPLNNATWGTKTGRILFF